MRAGTHRVPSSDGPKALHGFPDYKKCTFTTIFVTLPAVIEKPGECKWTVPPISPDRVGNPDRKWVVLPVNSIFPHQKLRK